MDDEPQPHLSALAKGALASSFGLAIAIWFLVDEKAVQPAPRKATHDARKAEMHAERRKRAGTARDELRRVVHLSVLDDEAKSKEVQEAAGDPNSMFAMETP